VRAWPARDITDEESGVRIALYDCSVRAHSASQLGIHRNVSGPQAVRKRPDLAPGPPNGGKLSVLLLRRSGAPAPRPSPTAPWPRSSYM
jgi:hypothetical protein